MMREYFKYLLVFCSVFVFFNISYAVSLTTKQTNFIKFLLPKIHKVNAEVFQQRNKLMTLYNEFQQHDHLSQRNINWIINIASRYGVENFNIQNQNDWQQLISRVDIIPAPLVLAQAINESAWGTSRFAKNGNNYFGLWCMRPGCGMVPRQRSREMSHEVRVFNNATHSIKSYMLLLNSKYAYKKLRVIRAEERRQGNSISSLSLAAGLKHYSQLGQRYVASIKSIIKNYQLNEIIKQNRLNKGAIHV